MNGRARAVWMLLAGAAMVAAGWWSWTWYAKQRRALDLEITRYQGGLESREVELLDVGKVKRSFEDFCAISLGSTEEEANAAVRRALNEMAAFVGLRKAAVSTSSARPVPNPAARARLREYGARAERERPDFYSISATLTGEGSLDQAVRTVSLLEDQDWVCRVDGFGMRAFGKEREGIDLSVTVTAMFLPGRKATLGAESGGRIWSPLDEAKLDRWRAIVTKNVFKEPPPPPAPVVPKPPPTAVAEAPPAPPPPPQPSLGDWRVSAVVQGRGGPELWIINDKTGEARMLAAGSQVLDAVFITGSGESARIRIGQEVFEVRLGSTLADRKPAS